MKNNDLFLYGGLAFAAWYLFIKPKTAQPLPSGTTVVPVAPVTSVLVPANTGTSNLLTSINNAISNLLPKPVAPVVTVQAPLTASGTTAIATPLQTESTPVVMPSDAGLIYVNNDQSLYKMFQNGDYPGAVVGYIQEEIFG
jgi:hypothetical protein